MGRIIRERKSLPGALVLVVLVRGLSLGFWSVVDAGSDERGALWRRFDAVSLAGPFTAAGLFTGAAFVGFETAARLSGRGGAVLLVLADEAAVDAVAAPGKRTGRVGDLGLGLIVFGECGPDLLGAPLLAEALGFVVVDTADCGGFALVVGWLDFCGVGFLTSFFAGFGASVTFVSCLELRCLGDAVFLGDFCWGVLLAVGDAGVIAAFAGALELSARGVGG